MSHLFVVDGTISLVESDAQLLLGSGREPGFVKGEALWQKSRKKQYRGWWQNLFLLLTTRSRG